MSSEAPGEEVRERPAGGPVALHHRIDGPADAPVVVLIHLLGGSHAMWEPQRHVLAPGHRVVRCDLRGHGASPAPHGSYEMADLGTDVLALLDHIGAERAHVVGISLGGMVAMWLAARHPERVDKLVLISTSAQLGPAERWRERAERVRTDGVESIADDVVSRWFTPGYRARQPAEVAAVREMLVATPAGGYAACCGAIERMHLTADLSAIRAPTLAIAAADDQSTPPEHLHRIARAVPGARVVVLEDAAHLTTIERAGEVNALLLEHLGGAVL